MKVIEYGNREATYTRLGLLHGQTQVDYNKVYGLLGSEMTPNAAYKVGKIAEFERLFSSSVLLSQNNNIYTDYRNRMRESYLHGDYFFFDTPNLPTLDRRMILNLKTQSDAILLAEELRDQKRMAEFSFKLYLQDAKASFNAFKYDKIVIYFHSSHQAQVEACFANTRVASAAFLPELSAFYDICRIGEEPTGIVVGVGKEGFYCGKKLISFTENCTFYILSILSGVDIAEVKAADKSAKYTVTEEILKYDVPTFIEWIFNRVYPHVKL